MKSFDCCRVNWNTLICLLYRGAKMSLMSQRPSYRWGLEYEVAVSHEKHSRPILWTSFFMPILPFSSHETSCNECIANISLPMIFRWHIFVLCLWTVRESLWIKVFRDSPNLYRAYRVIQNNDKMGKNYKTLTWDVPQNRVYVGYSRFNWGTFGGHPPPEKFPPK